MARIALRVSVVLVSGLVLGLVACGRSEPPASDSMAKSTETPKSPESGSGTPPEAQQLLIPEGCSRVVGDWSWFTGGVVHFRDDGTVVHELGNDGTWECTDPSFGVVTVKWRVGGYVNTLGLSLDGEQLSSQDPTQSYVSATRVAGSFAPPPSPTPPLSSKEEIAQLVKRINDSYHDATYADFIYLDLDSPDYIRTGISVSLDDAKNMVARQRTCGASFDLGIPMSIFICNDDTALETGWGWEETSIKVPLASLDTDTIEVRKPAKGDDQDRFRQIEFHYQGRNEEEPEPGPTTLGCKNAKTCEQAAADLKRLVELVRAK